MSDNETKPLVYYPTQNKYLINIRCMMVIIKKGQKVVKQENSTR